MCFCGLRPKGSRLGILGLYLFGQFNNKNKICYFLINAKITYSLRKALA